MTANYNTLDVVARQERCQKTTPRRIMVKTRSLKKFPLWNADKQLLSHVILSPEKNRKSKRTLKSSSFDINQSRQSPPVTNFEILWIHFTILTTRPNPEIGWPEKHPNIVHLTRKMIYFQYNDVLTTSPLLKIIYNLMIQNHSLSAQYFLHSQIDPRTWGRLF